MLSISRSGLDPVWTDARPVSSLFFPLFSGQRHRNRIWVWGNHSGAGKWPAIHTLSSPSCRFPVGCLHEAWFISIWCHCVTPGTPLSQLFGMHRSIKAARDWSKMQVCQPISAEVLTDLTFHYFLLYLNTQQCLVLSELLLKENSQFCVLPEVDFF